MKSGSAGTFLSAASHSSGSSITGSSTTLFPERRIRTLSPLKRNSCGSRTAWLLPLRNNLANWLIFDSKSGVYTYYIYWSSASERLDSDRSFVHHSHSPPPCPSTASLPLGPQHHLSSPSPAN